MDVLLTRRFQRRFRELPQGIRRKTVRHIEYFRTNPSHPSLHIEKLQPAQLGVWSFRVDRGYRIVFRFDGAGNAILLTVGQHDQSYRDV